MAQGLGGMPMDMMSMASGGAQVDDGWLERFLAAGQVGPSLSGECSENAIKELHSVK